MGAVLLDWEDSCHISKGYIGLVLEPGSQEVKILLLPILSVTKSGSWFSYGESKLAQGREAVLALLKDNPELCEELEAKVREAINQ